MGTLVEGAGELFAPFMVEERRTFSMKELVTEFPDGRNDWTIQEAFLCLVLSAALADGRIAPQEAEELRALSHRSRILKTLDANELAEINKAVVKRREDRPDWLGECCRALPLDMHLSIFAHCLDICLADGSMATSEAEFLEALLDHLNLSADDIRQATRIISIKNRY